MLPMLLILLTGFTGLAEGILIKQYNKRHAKGGFIFIAIVCLFAALFFIGKDLLTDPTGLNFSLDVVPYAVFASVAYASASVLTFIALGCGSFTLSMLLLSYSGVFSILYGLLVLKESVSVYTYIGLAIVMVSLFLTRGKKEENSKGVSLKWAVTIGLSVLGSGMFGVLMRMQQFRFRSTQDNEFMILTLTFSAVALLVVGIFKNGRDLPYILRHGAPYAALAGISNGITNGLSLLITTMMLVSVATPLNAGVKILLSFAVSLLFFREKFLKRQIVGVALGTVALVFLNL